MLQACSIVQNWLIKVRGSLGECSPENLGLFSGNEWANYKFFLIERSELQCMMSHSERASERRSLEVDLLRLNGFELYFKFTRENNDWHMAVSGGGGGEGEISLTVLLVNFHVVTGRIFDRPISHPWKWHNQPGKKLRTLPNSSLSYALYNKKVSNERTLPPLQPVGGAGVPGGGGVPPEISAKNVTSRNNKKK